MKLITKKTYLYRGYKFDFFMVMWLILLSGSQSLKIIPATTYITCFFGIFYTLVRKDFNFFKKMFISVSFFVIIFLGQYLTLPMLPLKYPAGTLVMLIAGGFIYYKVGINFRFVYLKVMYFFCAVSLVLWLLQVLFGIVFNLFSIPSYKDILVWSVRADPYNASLLETRNGGPVWEPGAFAGYILLTFFMYIGDLKYLWKNYRNEFIVLFLALITTVSTTGYTIAFLIFIYHIIKHTKYKMVVYTVVLPAILFGTLILYQNLDFLGGKIESQFNMAEAGGGETFSNTRFGSFYFDLQYIEKSPFFGNGVDPHTRWGDHPDLVFDSLNGNNLGHGNGFSGFLASMGVVAMLFILVNVYLVFKKSFGYQDALFIVFVFILLLQGESFFNYPLLFCLFLIKLPILNTKRKLL